MNARCCAGVEVGVLDAMALADHVFEVAAFMCGVNRSLSLTDPFLVYTPHTLHIFTHTPLMHTHTRQVVGADVKYAMSERDFMAGLAALQPRLAESRG